MSPEPFVSRAKALPAKRSEKSYGDENGGEHGESVESGKKFLKIQADFFTLFFSIKFSAISRRLKTTFIQDCIQSMHITCAKQTKSSCLAGLFRLLPP